AKKTKDYEGETFHLAFNILTAKTPAVSVRRRLLPKVMFSKPAFFAKIISSSVKSPSGPIQIKVLGASGTSIMSLAPGLRWARYLASQAEAPSKKVAKFW